MQLQLISKEQYTSLLKWLNSSNILISFFKKLRQVKKNDKNEQRFGVVMTFGVLTHINEPWRRPIQAQTFNESATIREKMEEFGEDG